MEATSSHPIVPGTRPQILGGDRFYILARWMVVILMLGATQFLTNGALWPPFTSSEPLLNLVWMYTFFTIVATIVLLRRPLNRLRVVLFIVDLVVISLMIYFDHSSAELLYTLYLLPLIGAALQISPRAGLLLGIGAAATYLLAYLLPLVGPDNGIPPQTVVEVMTLALKAAAFIFWPWMIGGLAERTTSVNRASVALAEQETQRAYREATSYREQMRSLYEVAYTLSTTMNYQSVLDVTLTESYRIVPYDIALVLLSTGNTDELYVAAAHGLEGFSRNRNIQIAEGKLFDVLRSGQPSLIADISQESAAISVTNLERCHAACAVPLKAGMNTYGLLLVASASREPFSDDQLGMITALANYAIIALHNSQLVQDLREERTKLISKEEEVRHQLARDLHDGPAQSLAAIAMNVEFVKRLIERDPPRVMQELDKLGNLARRTTHEVRTMLFELRPLALETQGLDVTLQQYFERFQGSSTEIVLEADQIRIDLDTKIEGTLFNIIQESVNNALKHAQAKHVWVRVKQVTGQIEATIQDDGEGFDLQKVLSTYEQRGSFGLLNIDERAKLIGGRAEIHSAPGAGTTVRVFVPVQ